MAVWSDRQDIEHRLRLMAETGDPIAEIRLSLLLAENGHYAEAERLRRMAAEGSGDDPEIMLMLGEVLRDAELGARETAIRRHFSHPDYLAERGRCTTRHGHGEIGGQAPLARRRPRSPCRTPGVRWSSCAGADAVVERRHRRDAGQGSTEAMRGLADLSEYCGDLREAQRWLAMAAKAGDREAAARCDEIAVRLDREAEMEQWFRWAAERDCADAMRYLAELSTLRGDTAGTQQWLSRAVDLHDSWAESLLPLASLRSPEGGAELESRYRKAAASGRTDLMRQLARLAESRGDIEQAQRWLRAAFDAGDEEALDDIRMLLRRRQDRGAEIESLHRVAAGRGSAVGMRGLADLFEARGDLAEAERWLRAAQAAGDHFLAAGQLSNLLESQGRQSEMQAFYRDSAAAGNRSATYRLDAMVERFGVETETERWYRQAALSGRTDAMFGLARMLERQGRAEQAESWLRAAAEGGNTLAVHHLAAMLHRQGRTAEAEPWLSWSAELRRTERDQTLIAGDWLAPVVSAVIAVAIVPFVNALIAKAAEETFAGARSLIRRLVDRDGRDDPPTLRMAGQLLVVEDPDPQLNISLHLWADVPDEAIRALADLDLTELTRAAGTGRVRIHWNRATRCWQVLGE